MDECLRILLVDDDRTDRIAIERALRKADLSVDLTEASKGAEGLALFHDGAFDCVLLDYRLPDRDGSDVLREMIADAEIPVPIIMLTGMQDEGLALQLLEDGAFDYLIKTELRPASLARAIRYALARRCVLRKEVEERQRVAHLADEKAQLIEAIGDQNRLLEAKNRRLSELYDVAHQFVDNASHEFRTPLTVIKEFAGILGDGLAGELSEEQLELVDVILHRTDDLAIMVNDMLDTSKLETGLLGLARTSCRVDDIIERHRCTLEGRAAAGHVTLSITPAPTLPSVFCDPEKIGRVIINLAINAIKFSGENGRVELWSRYDAETAMVMVGVTDDGPGIAQENLEAIFERFRQVGGPVRTSTKGFGLGLNIAKELVHLNLGDMTVTSAPGEGSTFSFTVPVAEPGRIADRFLGYVEKATAQAAAASLIIAEAAPEAPAVLEDLHAFLEEQLRASDLVLRSRPDRWLLALGQGERALAGFVGRIEAARINANRNRISEALPALHLEPIGSWPLPQGRQDVIARVDAELGGAESLALAS